MASEPVTTSAMSWSCSRKTAIPRRQLTANSLTSGNGSNLSGWRSGLSRTWTGGTSADQSAPPDGVRYHRAAAVSRVAYDGVKHSRIRLARNGAPYLAGPR